MASCDGLAWSARVPLDPLFARRINCLPQTKSRPGGRLRTRASAPQFMQVFGDGKNEWDWVGNPPVAPVDELDFAVVNRGIPPACYYSVLKPGANSVKVYESKDIRNVGVVGHGDSGKTTLTAGLLFTAGASNRLLRVDEGNTITDFDEEEIQRKITISTAIAVAEWKKTKINLLDTPGYNIFIND